MANDKTTAVVALPEQYPALAPDSIGLEIIRENIGEGDLNILDLDRIKIPAGGGTTWEVPAIDGIQGIRDLEVVIIAWRQTRLFWETSLDDADEVTPPDCASDDGRIGLGMFGPGSAGNPTGDCASCPMNVWGSDIKGGEGKGCREQRQLIVLLPGGILPMSVSLPPTSILPLKKYMLRLASASLPFYSVTTKLLLDPQKQGGRTWSVARPEMGSKLPQELIVQAKAYGDRMRVMMDTPRAARPIEASEA